MDSLIVNDAIVLNKITSDDAPEVFGTIDSQREYLGEWLPFISSTKELSDTLEFIKSINYKPALQRDLVYVIRFNKTFAGLIAFKAIDWANKKTEMGYWLSQPFQGKGIITQSCMRMLSFAFLELGLNKVHIKVAIKNTRSNKIPQKLGFKQEGIEREGELISNIFQDLNVYGILKNEFIRNSKPYLLSNITCPVCSFKKEEVMPENACTYLYKCCNCANLIYPGDGDCCVFCSFGSVVCPPVQKNISCC